MGVANKTGRGLLVAVGGAYTRVGLWQKGGATAEAVVV